MTYTREIVTLALPAVWDDQLLVNGFKRDSAPDPDMPKAAPDKKKSGTHIVVIADIKRAWTLAPLTLKQRQAVILRYGMDEPVEEAAILLGIRKSGVTERCERAVGVMVGWLNGSDGIEGEDSEWE